ncbi:MAG: hypothetical protein U0802_22815 [Candidatus Binatia bacterium]
MSRAATLPAVASGAAVRARGAALTAVLVLGALLRLAYVDRPFDYRIAHPWRQLSDYLAITRSFARGPRHPLSADRLARRHARLRRDGAAGDPVDRRAHLPRRRPLGAGAARPGGGVDRGAAPLRDARDPPAAAGRGAGRDLAIAVNPVLLVLATAIQPEPLLDVCCLLAVLLLWRWREQPGAARLLLAAAAQRRRCWPNCRRRTSASSSRRSWRRLGNSGAARAGGVGRRRRGASRRRRWPGTLANRFGSSTACRSASATRAT